MSDSILEFYQTHVEGLSPGSNDNWNGFCPIHGETPGRSRRSFSVNVENGLWCCFSGCGGGGIKSFLISLEYPKKRASRIAGDLQPYISKEKAKKQARRRAAKRPEKFKTRHPLPEELLGVFQETPKILVDDGFDEDVLRDHDIGYDEDLNRLTFPVRDLSGVLAGVVGRALDPGSRWKYKPYVDELKQFGIKDYSFKKGNYLWRWERLYEDYQSSKRPTTILVEGYKAALWLVQNGYDNTGALQGVALTGVHRAFLERMGGDVLIFLDNNKAGQKSVPKIVTSLRASGIDPWIVPYPGPGIQQPDDLEPADLHTCIREPLRFANWRRSKPCSRRNQH